MYYVRTLRVQRILFTRDVTVFWKIFYGVISRAVWPQLQNRFPIDINYMLLYADACVLRTRALCTIVHFGMFSLFLVHSFSQNARLKRFLFWIYRFDLFRLARLYSEHWILQIKKNIYIYLIILVIKKLYDESALRVRFENVHVVHVMRTGHLVIGIFKCAIIYET